MWSNNFYLIYFIKKAKHKNGRNDTYSLIYVALTVGVNDCPNFSLLFEFLKNSQIFGNSVTTPINKTKQLKMICPNFC